jgi:hypothetical protein
MAFGLDVDAFLSKTEQMFEQMLTISLQFPATLSLSAYLLLETHHLNASLFYLALSPASSVLSFTHPSALSTFFLSVSLW